MNAAGHLSPAEATVFLRLENGLPAVKRLVLSDHIAACAACRALLDAVRNESIAAGGGLPDFAHLFSGLIEAGRQGESPGVEPWAGETEFTRHPLPASTPGEREELSLFQNRLSQFDEERFVPGSTLKPDRPPAPRKMRPKQEVVGGWRQFLFSGPGFALAGAMAVLLLAMVLTLPRAWRPAAGRVATITGESSRRNDLTDGPVQVRVDGSVDGLAFLPADLRDAVLETIRRGAAPGKLLGSLTRGGDSGLSPSVSSTAGQDSPILLPISPVKTSVETDRPTFRWRLPVSASPVEVLLQPSTGEAPFRSGSLPAGAVEWTPAVPLARGTVYRWQVLPVPPDGQNRASGHEAKPGTLFKILSTDAHARLDALRAAPAGKSHLALGVAYAREGLREEAAREFRALREQNAQSTLARRLLNSVEG